MACDRRAKIRLFATFDDDLSHCETSQSGLFQRSRKHRAFPVKEGPEETPMLYIFKNNDGVQIAWNSALPKRDRQSRKQQLDTRFSLLGFIRTSNAG
jgi:hypothetical protein